MTGFTVAAAATVREARALLLGATPPNSSFTQAGSFSAEKIARAYRLGLRKPSWTWFAVADPGADRAEGEVLGVVAGWGAAGRSTPAILDVLDLPADPVVASALLDRAVADSAEPGRASIEVIHFIPRESRLDDPDLSALVHTLAASGFGLLVRRRRYRLVVGESPLFIPRTRLRFESLASESDPRLPEILAEILVGSLDAHDRAALARAELATADLETAALARAELEEVALETAARATAAEFLEGDPWDSFFLAIDPADAIVGLVVCGLRGSPDVGVASFVGVSHRHRGNGYGAQLLGFMTDRLVAANARVLIGETDDDNFPMDAAFRAVGFPHTESRIDFVRELGPGADGT